MPKYYFDVEKNGEISVDRDGSDLVDDSEAHREAIMAIAEIAAEEIPRDGNLRLVISVADQDHRNVLRTVVSFERGDRTHRPGASAVPAPRDGQPEDN